MDIKFITENKKRKAIVEWDIDDKDLKKIIINVKNEDMRIIRDVKNEKPKTIDELLDDPDFWETL